MCGIKAPFYHSPSLSITGKWPLRVLLSNLLPSLQCYFALKSIPPSLLLPYDALWILQQPLPLDRLREDLSLQPHFVAVVEVLRQVHALAQHALQAVVHGREVVVLVLVVAAAVELLDALPQSALLRLEIPRPGINIWDEEQMTCYFFSLFPFSFSLFIFSSIHLSHSNTRGDRSLALPWGIVTLKSPLFPCCHGNTIQTVPPAAAGVLCFTHTRTQACIHKYEHTGTTQPSTQTHMCI